MDSLEQSDSSPASIIEAERSGVVNNGEARIEYFSIGQGPAVVMLPGGGLTVAYLEDLAHALAAAGYQAVRVNPRGAGQSTGPAADVTYHTLADDVAAVITSLGIAPVTVAGHAFGNRIARTLAADRPELIASVVLLAAGGKVPPTAEAGKDLQTIFTPSSSEEDVLAAMPSMLGNPDNAASAWKILGPSRAPVAAGIQAAAAGATPLEAWWSPPGQSPYLVIQGLRDQAAPPANGQLLKEQLLDRVTLVDLPNAGHLAPIESPQDVAAALIAFLRVQTGPAEQDN